MLNLTLLLTRELIHEAHNFEAHHNVLGLTGPNDFSGVIGFPKSVNDLLGNWYHWRKSAS